MSKPTSLPEWASSVSADITEPTLPKKQLGWIVEQPPHDYFNWWQNLVFKWMQWVDAFESTIHSWTARQTFSAAVSVGGDIAADVAGANTGSLTNSLRFGSTTSGEGIFSKRDAGGNQFGLDICTNSLSRLSIANDGTVTIGALADGTKANINNNGGSSPAFASADVVNRSGFVRAQFWKNSFGEVTVTGDVSYTASGSTKTLFTLPSGYRPPTTVWAVAAAGGTTPTTPVLMTVDSSGAVVVRPPGSNDGAKFTITFKTDLAVAP